MEKRQDSSGGNTGEVLISTACALVTALCRVHQRRGDAGQNTIPRGGICGARRAGVNRVRAEYSRRDDFIPRGRAGDAIRVFRDVTQKLRDHSGVISHARR